MSDGNGTGDVDVPRGTSERFSEAAGLDLSAWLTKAQAADALQVTTKTVEQFAKDGKLQQARYRRPTGGPELAVYHPGDVARLATQRLPGPLPAFLVPDPPAPPPPASTALQRPPVPPLPTGEDVLRLVFAAAHALHGDTASQTSEKLWLTIREAAALSGLPTRDLRHLIKAGRLRHFRTARAGVRIRRHDLQAFDGS